MQQTTHYMHQVACEATMDGAYDILQIIFQKLHRRWQMLRVQHRKLSGI